MAGAAKYRAEKENMNLLKVPLKRRLIILKQLPEVVMKAAVLILMLTLFKPKRTLQLSAIEKAMSRQYPNDVGEEASDQSVYF